MPPSTAGNGLMLMKRNPARRGKRSAMLLELLALPLDSLPRRAGSNGSPGER
jgi:hypothetical protein